MCSYTLLGVLTIIDYVEVLKLDNSIEYERNIIYCHVHSKKKIYALKFRILCVNIQQEWMNYLDNLVVAQLSSC